MKPLGFLVFDIHFFNVLCLKISLRVFIIAVDKSNYFYVLLCEVLSKRSIEKTQLFWPLQTAPLIHQLEYFIELSIMNAIKIEKQQT